jgi:hypothetical protein
MSCKTGFNVPAMFNFQMVARSKKGHSARVSLAQPLQCEEADEVFTFTLTFGG